VLTRITEGSLDAWDRHRLAEQGPRKTAEATLDAPVRADPESLPGPCGLPNPSRVRPDPETRRAREGIPEGARRRRRVGPS
ncbi:hypothetical protein ACWDTT_20380, partial [Streptosporangium sandarakinum]